MNPYLEFIEDGIIKSRPVLVYYQMTPVKANVVVGCYCKYLFDNGTRSEEGYWMEEGYGLFIESVIGWSDIPGIDNQLQEGAA